MPLNVTYVGFDIPQRPFFIREREERVGGSLEISPSLFTIDFLGLVDEWGHLAPGPPFYPVLCAVIVFIPNVYNISPRSNSMGASSWGPKDSLKRKEVAACAWPAEQPGPCPAVVSQPPLSE